jgi:hypothetical protein
MATHELGMLWDALLEQGANIRLQANMSCTTGAKASIICTCIMK